MQTSIPAHKQTDPTKQAGQIVNPVGHILKEIEEFQTTYTERHIKKLTPDQVTILMPYTDIYNAGTYRRFAERVINKMVEINK